MIRPNRIRVDVIENGYVVRVSFVAEAATADRYERTVDRQWVAYNGADLDKTIAEIKEMPDNG